MDPGGKEEGRFLPGSHALQRCAQPWVTTRSFDSTWTSEDAIDFDDADAARWAAEAVAAEVGNWNVQACREFWEWWFAKAVPAAWHGTPRVASARLPHPDNPTFVATLVLETPAAIVDVDSRPRDALGLALRAGVPIRAPIGVLDAVGLSFETIDTETGDPESESTPPQPG
jgi:hypothetical protein